MVSCGYALPWGGRRVLSMKASGWKREFETGIPVIDHQHRRLLEGVESCIRALSHGAAKGVVIALVRDIQAHAIDHFRDEEDLMQRSGFPEFEDHHARHVELAAVITDLTEDYMSGRLAVPIQVVRTFSHWMEEHLSGDDKRAAAWIRSHMAPDHWSDHPSAEED